MNQEIVREQDGYTEEVSREFFRSVYSYMFLALGVSGVVAFWVGTPEFFFQYFADLQMQGEDIIGYSLSPLFYIVAFAPLGLGLWIQMGYRRLSFGLLVALFMLYAVLMGMGLSTIFLAYSMSTIAITFFVSAGAFGGMAILGYTTKTDLTKFGSLMYMLFIGIFIASLANWFFKSEGLDMIIAYIGVFVFTGLTAYFMQQLKSMSSNMDISGIERSKLAIVGGLMLYILFINLFMALLRIFGGRD